MRTPGNLTRRDLLKLVAAGVVGVVGAFELGLFDRESDAPTAVVDDSTERRLAERFAPTYYFDAHERWYPTDPRPYEREADGETVVDGFAAFDGYTRQYREEGDPPEPTVFYRVLGYEGSPLAVVQYWSYSVFDQFTTNFHWHDWELTQVFVDLETDDPVLIVGSAHSRQVPNNEYLDPRPTTVTRVLAELGSHSGGLSVNDVPDRFSRLPQGATVADVTNGVLDGIEFDLPAAYGLPRDEGFALPYVVPELDGAPIYEHDRLPSVDRAALVDPALTVRSYEEIASPPTGLPGRETGLVFGHTDDADAHVTYDLVATAELEHVAAFTGPQLSFEFAVPAFGEDLIASHITTTGVPWEQPRYDDPAEDISDPAHRATLADRYDVIGDPAPVNRLVAAVRRTGQHEDAPDGEGVDTREPSVETVCLVESEPAAVPTFAGVAVIDGLPAGDHRLTINGAGFAPYSQQVSVTDSPGTDLAGVEGEVALTATGDAVKVEVDADAADVDLTDLAIEDDFGGRLYDAPLSGPDAVYVDRGGAYTTEVRDADGELGAFRVNPDGRETVRIDRPRTGKAALAEFVSELGRETQDRVRVAADLDEEDGDSDDSDVNDGSDGSDGNDGSDETTGARTTDGRETTDARTTGGGSSGSRGVRGLLDALAAVAAAAERAAGRAADGDRNGADRALETVEMRLENVAEQLEAAKADLPDPVAAAVDRRLEQARRRVEQALDAGKL